MAGFLPDQCRNKRGDILLIRSLSTLFVISLAVSACSQTSPGPVPVGPGGKMVFTGDQKADWAQIVALEDQAKALVKAGGCSSAAQCRTAAVGSRACGGPRYYLVYCSLTTDSAALFQKLGAVAGAEREYNEHYQIASTCEFRMPPTVGLTGGSCQAQQSPPAQQPQ
ncbi:MAG TPA: hypothetical protein VD771_05805 [Gemmatimonadaceae bacterium]|nr:hypothetical protein [Gemmatimonadaceae bacterium]